MGTPRLCLAGGLDSGLVGCGRCRPRELTLVVCRPISLPLLDAIVSALLLTASYSVQRGALL